MMGRSTSDVGWIGDDHIREDFTLSRASAKSHAGPPAMQGNRFKHGTKRFKYSSIWAVLDEDKPQ